MADIQFHGAAGEVTGSMHILHTPDGTVLLDSGLFQGKRKDARAKNKEIPIDPKEVQSILLSHAHIDHSGNIPFLVRNGFRSAIYATNATCDLCDIMLTDSAHIQEEDARYWNKKRAKNPEDFIEPHYTIPDAKNSQKYFHGIPYNTPTKFTETCTATWLEAGHILGSSCILIEIPNGTKNIRLLYTGDLGRFDMPILKDPTDPLPQADYLITECTYANRRHHNPTDMKEQLVKIINETRQAGGKVIIPAFSVGRTQNVVYYLANAIAEGLLEPLPIFIDSPLSTHATEVFAKHSECYDERAKQFLDKSGNIFGAEMIEYVTDVDRSKSINRMHEPMVIIASSGMCEAGRILHHLKNNIEDDKNTVVVVGFMAQHTLGRRIVERREELKIFGRMYKLNCRVEILNGFSAHADADDFAKLLSPIAPNLKGAFIVHGEDQQPEAMKGILYKAGCKNIHAPKPGEKFEL